jgi:hypothetical protein
MRYAMHAAAAFLAAAVSAPAETEPREARASSGTTLSLQAGVTSGSMDGAGQALGGTLVQGLGARWAVQASAAYLAEGRGADALALDASVLFHLRPTCERAAPYLALGGGLYRTSFDMGDSRMRDEPWAPRGGGPRVPGMTGGPYGPGPNGAGPGQSPYGHMPSFYAHRMPAGPEPSHWQGQRSFTDPAVSAGAGVRIDLGSRMSLRPDGRVLLAFSGGDTFTVGLVTVSFGWSF